MLLDQVTKLPYVENCTLMTPAEKGSCTVVRRHVHHVSINTDPGTTSVQYFSENEQERLATQKKYVKVDPHPRP